MNPSYLLLHKTQFQIRRLNPFQLTKSVTQNPPVLNLNPFQNHLSIVAT